MTAVLDLLPLRRLIKPVAFRKVAATGRATPWHRTAVRESYGAWRCGCWANSRTMGPGSVEYRYRTPDAAEKCWWWKTR